MTDAGKLAWDNVYVPQWTDLVTVFNMFEGEIIKALMDSHDIPVRLSYESLEAVGIQIRATFSGRAAGIRVQVPDACLEQARQLMEAQFIPPVAARAKVRFKGIFGRIKTRMS